MAWIADANLPVIAIWTAIVLSGLATGTLLSRWRDPGRVSPHTESLLLAGAAAAVIAWCAIAGAVAGNSASNGLLTAYVPIDTTPVFRLAVLWATLPGAALTFAAILLVWATFSGQGEGRSRYVGATTAAAFIALGLAAWFAPESGTVAAAIPPFVQSTSAALAPLFALLAVVGLTPVVASSLLRSASPDRHRAALLGAWIAASAAVISEQTARSRLGIGPRDAVVFGSASSGLMLWLVTSALLHRRVQSILFRMPRQDVVHRGRWARFATRAGHAGALCLAVSFTAHAFASRSTISLPPGASVDITDSFRRTWHLVNQGVSRFDAEGVDVTALALEARSPAGRLGLLTPEIREYHSRSGQHLSAPISLRSEVGGVVQTMRVLLAETDSLDVARVRVTFLPAPILWPIGVGLLCLAAMVALFAPESRLTT